MSDFTSEFWSVFVALITVGGIVACALLVKMQTTKRAAPGEAVGTTGHVWDDDLTEWNNPLPRWWMWLFYITLAFGLAYVVLFPGLGSYPGLLGWTSRGEYRDEQARADRQYGPIFEKYLKQDVMAVAADPEARQMGQRLFLTYCSQCHGSDAAGARGYPNLTDRQWLYGGDPAAIKASIANGRNGVMPPMGAALGGGDAVKDVAHYVLSLSGRPHDALRAARGKGPFQQVCAACHTAAGTGNPALGAPNLTDKDWLYGGSEEALMETINKGRQGAMPAWQSFLGDGKIHLLTAYVWGLSNTAQAASAK